MALVSPATHSPQDAHQTGSQTDLHDLELLQPILQQLLYLAVIHLPLVLPESVSRASFRIFAEVVSGELFGLPEE